MKTRLDKTYLKILQPLLVLLVVTFPLANRDLFSILHPKLFPSRIVLAVIVGVSGLYWIGRFVATVILGRSEATTPESSSFPDSGQALRCRSGRARMTEKCKIFLKKDPVLTLLLFLLLVRLASIKNSLNLEASISILGYFASVVVLYLVLKYLNQIKPKFLFKLYKIHLGMVSLIAVYALIQLFLLFLGKKLPGVLYGSSFLRIPGTFYDANHLPPYILTALPFLAITSWSEKNSYKRFGLLTLAGIQGLALILTFSRSGFLGLAVAALALILFLIKFKMWRKIGLIAAALSIFLFFAYLSTRTNYSFFERAFSVFNPGEKSTSSHGLLYAGAIDLFTEHPLLGVGYGSFSEHFRNSRWGVEHGYIDPATYVRVPAHSLWFEALAETGLLGGIPFLILLAVFLHLPNKAFKVIKARRYSLEFAGLVSGVAGVLTGSIFYSYHLEFFWFFLFFAALYSRRILVRQEKEAFVEDKFVPEKIPWREIVPLTAITVWGGLFVFWSIWSGRLVTETEGIYAWISKYILRAGFRDWEKWWVPFYRESFWFEKSPLYFWLSVTVMFLYHITTFSARFWAAFMGLGTVITTYVLGRLMFGRFKGVLAAFLVVFWPLFVLHSHRGELIIPVLLLMNLVVLLFWLVRRFPICWPILGLIQGLFFWLDARAALASIFILFSLYLADFVVARGEKNGHPELDSGSPRSGTSRFRNKFGMTERGRRGGWGLLLFLLGFVPSVAGWPAMMNRMFASSFLNPYIKSMRLLSLELGWWQIVFAVFALAIFLWVLILYARPPERSEGPSQNRWGFFTLRFWAGHGPAATRSGFRMTLSTSFLSLWLFLSCLATSLIGNNLLILVPLCLLISHLATEFALQTRSLRYASLAVISIASILLTGLLWYKILPPSPHAKVLDMLDFRYEQDPDGNNSNFLVGKYTPIVEYYSDTPVRWFDSYEDLYQNLIIEPSEKAKKAKRKAYYLVDGYWFKDVVSDARSNNIGLRVLQAQGTMLLVEKF